MSTTVPMFTIDTLLFSKKLEKSGMKKETAEVLAEEIKEIQMQSQGALATKSDILILKSEISELKNEFKLIRHEIKIAMLTAMMGTGAIVALIEKFIN